VSLITLTTDFGSGSPYVAAMKGVILSINPRATVVDITHDIRPQDVRCGAIVLGDTAEWFPPDTIHVVVIDPGVGTDRAIVYARIGVKESSIEGEVLAIDSFGNLITNIAAGMLAGRPTDDRVRIVCGNHETRGICRTYGDRPPGTRIALLGSSGRLELAVVAGSAAESLGLRTGAAVAMTWDQ
jgi:S-adenosylmethionine hydrolase